MAICEACAGTGLENSETLCPACNGTPDSSDPVHKSAPARKRKGKA